MNIRSGETRGCSNNEYGSVDDNLSPILEDIEFYQISLTSDGNADVIPEHSVALIFIEDNDGKFINICVMYNHCKMLSSGRGIYLSCFFSEFFYVYKSKNIFIKILPRNGCIPICMKIEWLCHLQVKHRLCNRAAQLIGIITGPAEPVCFIRPIFGLLYRWAELAIVSIL